MSASAEAIRTAPPVAPPSEPVAVGEFVINLCSSTTPMALVQPKNDELRRFTFFVSRRREDGRERFRLHMGYFTTAAEAEEWMTVVREIYPAAWVGEAPGKKLRAKAAAVASADVAARKSAPHTNPEGLRPAAALPAHDLPPLPTLEVPALTLERGPRVEAVPVAAPAARVEPDEIVLSFADEPAAAESSFTGTDTLSNVREVIASLDEEAAAPPTRAASRPAAAVPQNVPTLKPLAPTKSPAVKVPPVAKAATAAKVVPTAKAAPAAKVAPTAAAVSAAKAAPAAKPPAPVAKPLPAATAIPAAKPVVATKPPVAAARPVAKPAAPPAQRAAPVPPTLSDSQVLRVLEERDLGDSAGQDRAAESAITLLRPEDTQTLRALKDDAHQNAPAQFAVQLDWSVTPIDISKVPPLAIFSAYTLYTVQTTRDGRQWYGLRLGFFSDAISAKQVAYYVRSDFTSVAVVPVSGNEKHRATVDAHDATHVGSSTRDDRKSREEFKLFDLEEPAAEPAEASSPAKSRVPDELLAAAKAGLDAGSRAGAVRASNRPAKTARKPRGNSLEQTLEQTLEILGASELEIDNGRGELLNDTGVRHLSVQVDKSTSAFSKLLDRLSDRMSSR